MATRETTEAQILEALHTLDPTRWDDALIAETAVGLGVALATFSDRHYRVVPTLHTIQPYERP